MTYAAYLPVITIAVAIAVRFQKRDMPGPTIPSGWRLVVGSLLSLVAGAAAAWKDSSVPWQQAFAAACTAGLFGQGLATVSGPKDGAAPTAAALVLIGVLGTAGSVSGCAWWDKHDQKIAKVLLIAAEDLPCLLAHEAEGPGGAIISCNLAQDLLPAVADLFFGRPVSVGRRRASVVVPPKIDAGMIPCGGAT